MSRVEVRTRKLHGSPHTVWSIFVDGVFIKGLLHPPSADILRDCENPKVYAPRPLEPIRSKPGPKGKGAKPAWSRDDFDMEDAA
jgi:hypothetical protein